MTLAAAPPKVHPTTRYAIAVVNGDIIAGELVRLACARHLRDLARQNTPGFPFHFDEEKANDAFDFWEFELCHYEGDMAGEPFVLLDWQMFIIGSVYGWVNRRGKRRFKRVFILTGKGPLALDTPIPTPTGWTTMGEIQVGDHVFDDQGRPTRVVDVSPTFQDRQCYRLSFSDGTSIVADEWHRWNTAALRVGVPRQDRIGVARKGGYLKRTTAEIAATLRMKPSTSLHPQAVWNHRVDVAPALELPDVADLPVPPYVLGAWLGDGASDSARLTCAYEDWQVVREIQGEGVTAEERMSTNRAPRIQLGGRPRGAGGSLNAVLRRAGLLDNKHIPPAYFRASAPQRLALLQGLMDTDGTSAPDGKCEISLCNQRLAADVLALIRTLGIKSTMRESDATIAGRVVGRRWRIGFQAYRDLPVFRLDRKLARLGDPPVTRALSRGRMIVGCDPVASVPVRCITVEAESHMFLAGEGLVPTCNSGKTPLCAGAQLKGLLDPNQPGAQVYSAATTREQANLSFKDAKAMARLSPSISARTHITEHAITFGNSYMQTVSSEAGNIHGKRPYVANIDEIHAHPNDDVVEGLRAGTKRIEEWLQFMPTNAGQDRRSLAWRYQEYTRRILDQAVADEEWFGFVCGLDVCEAHIAEGKDMPVDDCPGCDQWTDEAVWRKANPSIDVTPGWDYLRGQVNEAKNMPAKADLVKRLNFCIWTSGKVQWIRPEVLKGQEPRRPIEGRIGFAGYDLSAVSDLTAAAYLFPDADGDGVDIELRCFLPEGRVDELAEKSNVPYRRWATEGYLTLTPGNTINYDFVLAEDEKVRAQYQIDSSGIDPWQSIQFRASLEGKGIQIVTVPQTNLRLHAVVEEAERLLTLKGFRHGGNPILEWAASNVVLNIDARGMKRIDKQASPEKIDPVAAILNALSEAMVGQTETEGDAFFV